jgi:DGQHR domain-containing protein
MFKTRAIRFTQNGRVFYAAAIPAGKLVQMSKVDVWDPDNPTSGYQRAPSMARKREIGRYAMGQDAIMPLGGLLNARGADAEQGVGNTTYGELLEFDEEHQDGDISFGTLSIPQNALPLYIVDMQHRLGGYEWAMEQEGGEHLSDFPLVVTIADGLGKMEEVDQFDIINTTQKKVRTDLARRLKSIQIQDLDHKLALDQRGKLWEAKGPVIADRLNKSEGPWDGRILPPNKSKSDQPTMVMRETSFVTSLKPILQTPYFIRQSEEHAAGLISRYWEAVRKVWPEAFVNPDNYVIQKSPGVFSLHELAPEIFELARDAGDVTVENIYKVLRPLGDSDEVGDSEFWLADNNDGAAQYGSMKGFRILASILRQYLPNIEPV